MADPATPPSQPTPTFVCVGHCVPDTGMLRSAIGHVTQRSSIVRVNDLAGLRPFNVPGAIWLVNRVLDGDFGREDGLSLISEHARAGDDDGGPILILISNYSDAQEEAVQRGAMSGFGKRALYSDAARAILTTAHERAAAALARRAVHTPG